jgi:hypothetical protein
MHSISINRFGRYGLLALAALAMPQALHPANVVLPFNPRNFSNPLSITNPLFPLVAGKTYIYRGEGAAGCEEDRMAITNQTKFIAGVTARVVHDQVYAGETCSSRLALAEDTFDWYAQDNNGNVWYMGEDSRECDVAGRCVRSSGSWQAGVNGARAGIIMLTNPHSGDHYYQEFSVGVAEDEASVVGVGLNVTLTRPDAYRPRVFRNCIKTREYTRLEPSANGYKYYCPGIGDVMEDENDIHSELIAIR